MHKKRQLFSQRLVISKSISLLFMTWFIKEEITNDQDNKPNWADFKRFKRVWL